MGERNRMTRHHIAAYCAEHLPDHTVFEQSHGAKGICPVAPGYPYNCTVAGRHWHQVMQLIDRRAKAQEQERIL